MQRTDLTPQTGTEVYLSCLGLLLGTVVGLKFADIDQRVPNWLLYHRDILTHGLIVPMLLSWGVWRTKHQTVRGFTIGFCLTNAVHLSFDLFPRAWWGHALIHLFGWTFPPVLSWCWIAISMVLCVYLARFFIRTFWDVLVSGLGILIGFGVSAHEGLLLPLLAFLIAGILAFLFPLKKGKNGRKTTKS